MTRDQAKKLLALIAMVLYSLPSGLGNTVHKHIHAAQHPPKWSGHIFPVAHDLSHRNRDLKLLFISQDSETALPTNDRRNSGLRLFSCIEIGLIGQPIHWEHLFGHPRYDSSRAADRLLPNAEIHSHRSFVRHIPSGRDKGLLPIVAMCFLLDEQIHEPLPTDAWMNYSTSVLSQTARLLM